MKEFHFSLSHWSGRRGRRHTHYIQPPELLLDSLRSPADGLIAVDVDLKRLDVLRLDGDAGVLDERLGGCFAFAGVAASEEDVVLAAGRELLGGVVADALVCLVPSSVSRKMDG